MIRITDRLNGISESITLKLNYLANTMKAEGKDVINLTTGEPDFNVPEPGKKAVRDALDKNLSRYTPVPGVPTLRDAIAAKTNAQHAQVSKPWRRDNVLVTNGGKQALYNSLFTITNPGDEVIVFVPYWLSYPEMVRLAGAVPKFVETQAENQFFPTAEQFRSAITSKTRALILNSPSNPTGGVASLEQMKALGQVLREHPRGREIVVITDEIYDRLVYDCPFVSFLQANPDLQDQVITVNGCSKSGAMTGWRLGWLVTSAELVKSMTIVQGQVTSGVCALSQAAAEAVLKMPESDFDYWRTELKGRKQKGFDILKTVSSISVFQPHGAFYFWMDVRKILQKTGMTDLQLCEDMLKTVGVALSPGSPFGSDFHVRASFCIVENEWLRACEKMKQYFLSKS